VFFTGTKSLQETQGLYALKLISCLFKLLHEELWTRMVLLWVYIWNLQYHLDYCRRLEVKTTNTTNLFDNLSFCQQQVIYLSYTYITRPPAWETTECTLRLLNCPSLWNILIFSGHFWNCPRSIHCILILYRQPYFWVGWIINTFYPSL